MSPTRPHRKLFKKEGINSLASYTENNEQDTFSGFSGFSRLTTLGSMENSDSTLFGASYCDVKGSAL
jgi:hypothetical protein